ncbi:MAG: hypothetical protein IKL22_05870 [Lachnospiraceae bacterium]|nr:hypothetical protein [Lachnospiraceae bacterium]
MNKKICFIIRGENDFLCQEVLHYISYLTVPEGYEIEYTIKQGKVGQAYDAGMKETDAIIKVYLDENIFLVDKELLLDVVDIFEQNKYIEILGALGYKIARNNDKEEYLSVGNCYKLGLQKGNENYDSSKITRIEEVDALDVRCLFTCKDLKWQEIEDVVVNKKQLNNSKETMAVILNKKEPWCLFDNE